MFLFRSEIHLLVNTVLHIVEKSGYNAEATQQPAALMLFLALESPKNSQPQGWFQIHKSFEVK